MSTWGRRGLSRGVRRRVLERDSYTCQLQYPGCLGIASEIDDIVPVSLLGVPREQLDDDNRQSVCAPCHRRKTELHRITMWRASQQRRHERLHLTAPHPGDR